jgi:hypothetical protein
VLHKSINRRAYAATLADKEKTAPVVRGYHRSGQEIAPCAGTTCYQVNARMRGEQRICDSFFAAAKIRSRVTRL